MAEERFPSGCASERLDGSIKLGHYCGVFYRTVGLKEGKGVEGKTRLGKVWAAFDRVIEVKKLVVGVEIGIASGDHAEAILNLPNIDRLYGVDPYRCRENDPGLSNLLQVELDELYSHVLRRLAPFGERYKHVREFSESAVSEIPGEIDFVYLNAERVHANVWEDLRAWFPKVCEGGVLGGDGYGRRAGLDTGPGISEFFRRFDWEVHVEGEVWWVEKRARYVSFFMPVYNSAETVQESVESIMEGNFSPGDELVIVNDGSTDSTANVLRELREKYPEIRIIDHSRNRGGAATRNTAVENCRHSLLFCLDSDNILVPGSVLDLKKFLERTGADVACFGELHYFETTRENVVAVVEFIKRPTLANALDGSRVIPGASGNYMFTKESWIRAEGYPEFAGALDTWGFGFRQLATGSRMVAMPDSYYYHRRGHESYWIRDVSNRKRSMSLRAIQILIPFFDLLDERDIDYMMGEGRYSWWQHTKKHPIRLKQDARKVVRADGVESAIERLRKTVQAHARLEMWLKRRGIGLGALAVLITTTFLFVWHVRRRIKKGQVVLHLCGRG